VKGWRRVLTACENAFAVVGCAIFVFITLGVCAEVFFRYGFNSPIHWIVEISEYALLWVTFLGASWVLRQGGHVRVDILLQHLSRRALRVCGMLSAASGALVSLVLVGFGINVTWVAYLRGSFRSTGLDVPTWMIVIVIPLGSLLLVLRFADLFVDYYTRRRDFGAEAGH